MTETFLTRQHHGQTITAAIGDRIEVLLDETPTSGYTWANLSAGDSLTLEGSDFRSSGAPGDAGAVAVAGRGGQRQFHFSARQAGISLLQLKLMQAWMGQASSVDDFAVTVTIPPR